MSNNRDNGPELDYYELRRRHEEYKSRARAAKAAQNLEEAQSPAGREVPRAPQAQPPAPEPVAEEIPAEPEDPLAQYVESDDDAYEDEAAGEVEGAADGNPNPFDSFIRAFRSVKNSLAARREAKEAELENMDDLSDEELAALAEEDFGEDFAEPEDDFAAGGAGEAAAAGGYEIPAPEAGEALDVEALDIEAPEPVGRRARRRAAVQGEAEEMEPPYAEDGDEEAYAFSDEEDEPRSGGFRRFLNLFVERVDDAPEVEAVGAEESQPRAHRAGHKDAAGASDELYDQFIRSVHGESKGGQTMDEMNRPVSDGAQQATEGLETGGMSRRERRERAMRLAAEEAARKAEEARRAAETAAEPLFVDEPEPAAAAEIEPPVAPAVEAPVAPAEKELVTPVAQEPDMPVVEEPTREYKPVSVRDAQEPLSGDPFDLPGDAQDDEDEDDDGAQKRKASHHHHHHGIFAKRHASDEDEDEDDYDDEDEDDEDEDERPARRGLFGRRKRSRDDEDEDDDEDDYDDEDEDEDDDDYDDEDEDEDDDDYDEYDDEYDDDDDDEYDEGPHRSIGYHVVGVLKWVIGIIVVLAVAILAMNYFYSTGNPNLVPTLHNLMGDSPAFYRLFPSYEAGMQDEADPAVYVEPTQAPVEAATQAPVQTPEATVAVPSLDGDTTGADAQVETDPVVQSAPVSSDAQSATGTVG